MKNRNKRTLEEQIKALQKSIAKYGDPNDGSKQKALNDLIFQQTNPTVPHWEDSK